ncbi:MULTISPECIES: hypothetical protein [Pseudomonadaceae]|jgi:hypothetical protein|uniref:Uncharacterized protein n=1 Tax=Pseudomonas abyssi TaxID=170540 RepID=A0A395R2R8_9PSED|nr:hypothetical protein [Halopseudomonas gallaeciensis]RGP54393.1 hypothetical protein ASB58_10965 [Halopseudomonas gallaeciensis]
MRIELELTPQQVHALLEAARQQYRLRYQDEFWKERYSHLPHGLRHGSILAHCPDMAANKKLLGALVHALGQDTQPARVTP